MFIPAKGVFLLNIPKTGCNSFRKGLEAVHGKLPSPGHLKASQVDYEGEYWAVIREPVSRLVSAIRYVYGETNYSLDDAMDGCIRRTSRAFDRQIDYLDKDIPYRLFTFKQINEVGRLLGGRIPHLNRSVKKWSKEQIQNHPRYQEALNVYQADEWLHERATQVRGSVLCRIPYSDLEGADAPRGPEEATA